MASNKPKVITWTNIDIICHHKDTNGACKYHKINNKLCVEYIISRGHFHISVLSMWNLVTAPSIQLIWMGMLYTNKHIICVFAIIWSLLYTKRLGFMVKCIFIIWRSYLLDKFVNDHITVRQSISMTPYIYQWSSPITHDNRQHHQDQGFPFQEIPWTNVKTIVTVSTKA